MTLTSAQAADKLTDLGHAWLNGAEPTQEEWTAAIRIYITLRETDKASTPKSKKKTPSTPIDLDTLI